MNSRAVEKDPETPWNRADSPLLKEFAAGAQAPICIGVFRICGKGNGNAPLWSRRAPEHRSVDVR
jgi:hypothetical protein